MECGNEHAPSLAQFYSTILPVVVSDVLNEAKAPLDEVPTLFVSYMIQNTPTRQLV